MIRVVLDLKGFDYKKITILKRFLHHIPTEVRTCAVVDFCVNKQKIEAIGVQEIYGTYGGLIDKTDIFISFFNCNYIDIAGFLSKKRIFSVCYQESIKTNYFDLAIEEKNLFNWKYIYEKYNQYKNHIQNDVPHKRKRIAFITPLAKKSAIAKYSSLTLDELCKKADVDVYSLEKNAKNTFGAKNVFYLTPYPYLTDNYDAVITVIGDSVFHDRMYKFSVLYGGYTICHDANLLNYSYGLCGSKYLEDIARFYNHKKVNEKDIMFFLKNFDNLPFTAVEPVVESSKIMFTHSKILADTTKSGNIKYLPFCVYADIDSSKVTPVVKKRSKKELGFKDDDIIITSFGSIAPHKKSEFIAKAFINSKLPDNVYMIFVGNGANYSQFREIADKCKNIIYFKEFISKELYNKYLLASDFSIQLRNTTQGQVSGALADNIQAKLYTISCNDLTRAIDAPEYIHPLPDHFSVSDLTEEIKNVLKSKIYSKDFSKECDTYLSEHNFKNYVEILLKML